MWHQHFPVRKAFSDSLRLKIHHLCVEPRAGEILYDYGGSSIVRTMPKTVLSLLQCLVPFFILLPCIVLWLLVGLGPSLVTPTPKNLPAVQETWVQSLDWEDLLEKGNATYSCILAWRIPWTEEPVGLQSMELQRVGQNWGTKTHSSLSLVGLKGNRS